MYYVTFYKNTPNLDAYEAFQCFDDDEKPIVEDTDSDRRQLVKDLVAEELLLDHYILCKDVVYRLCRSSKQATKITGNHAKIVKRVVKVVSAQRAVYPYTDEPGAAAYTS